MPPRARKTAARKPAAPAEESPTVPETENPETAEESPTVPETENPETDEGGTDYPDAPKRRGGRKRSELAHAARAYEQADDAVGRLEKRYQAMAAKLSEVAAKLSEAREVRAKSWSVIEAARNARLPEVEQAAEDDDASDDDA